MANQKRKVTIQGMGWKFSSEEDITAIFEEIAQKKGMNSAEEFFKCGEFSEEFVQQYDNVHFLFQFCSKVAKSPNCPPAFLDVNQPVSYIVEKVA